MAINDLYQRLGIILRERRLVKIHSYAESSLSHSQPEYCGMIYFSQSRLCRKKSNPALYSMVAIIKELMRIQIKRIPGDVYALVINLSSRDEFMLKHLCLRMKYLDKVVKNQNLRFKGKV